MERKHLIEIVKAGKIFNNKYISNNEETGEKEIWYYFDNLKETLDSLGYSKKRLSSVGLKLLFSKDEHSVLLVEESINKGMPIVISANKRVDYLFLVNLLKLVTHSNLILSIDKLKKNAFIQDGDEKTLKQESITGLVEFYIDKDSKKEYILFSDLLIEETKSFLKESKNEL